MNFQANNSVSLCLHFTVRFSYFIIGPRILYITNLKAIPSFAQTICDTFKLILECENDGNDSGKVILKLSTKSLPLLNLYGT